MTVPPRDLTDAERHEALEAARWYVAGRVGELSAGSMMLIARLVLEQEAARAAAPAARPSRVLTATQKHDSR